MRIRIESTVVDEIEYRREVREVSGEVTYSRWISRTGFAVSDEALRQMREKQRQAELPGILWAEGVATVEHPQARVGIQLRLVHGFKYMLEDGTAVPCTAEMYSDGSVTLSALGEGAAQQLNWLTILQDAGLV